MADVESKKRSLEARLVHFKSSLKTVQEEAKKHEALKQDGLARHFQHTANGFIKEISRIEAELAGLSNLQSS